MGLSVFLNTLAMFYQHSTSIDFASCTFLSIKKVFYFFANLSPGSYRHKLLISSAHCTSSSTPLILSVIFSKYQSKVRGHKTLPWGGGYSMTEKFFADNSMPSLTHSDLSSTKNCKSIASSGSLKPSVF